MWHRPGLTRHSDHQTPEVQRVATPHDVLALLVASLCHDIDHPGNTNSFEINTVVRLHCLRLCVLSFFPRISFSRVIAHTTLHSFFLVQSDRALLHNDISVLENHHASTCFRILRQSRCNIFQHMSKQQWRQQRACIIVRFTLSD